VTRHSTNIGAIGMVLLMLVSSASAGLSVWVGPASLSGQTQTVSTAWEVPGNATVLDAWLNIQEDGMPSSGNGTGWHAEDRPGNFTSGLSSGTTMSHFDGSLSLLPNSSVSQVNQFIGSSYQLPLGWVDNSGVWEIATLTNITGTVIGNTRTVAHGQIPAQPYSGGLAIGTSPGSALNASTNASLETNVGTSLPSPISDFTFSFQHWYHLDTSANTNGDGDGAWVEYKLDSGQWTWLEPVGGYPNSVSSSAPLPNGASANGSHGFPVFASTNSSGWQFANFSLDNISGISNAQDIYFRFRVWTQSNGTQRPGWFIDDLDLTNIGNATGVWHHGCFNSNNNTCSYSNDADGVLEFPSIDLSTANSTVTVSFLADWDIEGASYDNWWLEASKDNSTWVDVTTNNLQYVTTGWNTPDGVPTDGVIIGGTTYTDDSGGWVPMHLDLPANFQGDNTTWIRLRVETDFTVTYGASPDSREGLTIDNLKVHESNSTYYFLDEFNSSGTAWHSAVNNMADDWQYLMMGMGGMTLQYGWEDAPSLPPGGWQVQNTAGFTGWEFGAISSSSSSGPSAWSSPPGGFGTVIDSNYEASSWEHLYSPTYSIPSGASARLTFDQWMCAEYGWDGGAVYISVNNGTWTHFNPTTANGSSWYDNTIQYNSNSPLINLGVFDGNAGSTFTTCTSTSLGWRTTTADLSNFSGSDVKFRFSFTADSAVHYDGWYLDDIGLEVDWFDPSGSWKSSTIMPEDLGMGFVDIDAVIPNGTWVSASMLDINGQVIAGFENSSFPMSLAALDLDEHSSGVNIRINMGSNNPILTPLVSALHVGSIRMMTGVGAESNGWTIPSGMVVNSTGVLTNPTGSTLTLTSDFIESTVPLDGWTLNADASAIAVSVIDIDGISYGSMAPPGASVAMSDAHPGFGLQVQVSPGGWIDSLKVEATMVAPAKDAAIDVAMDGTDDWEFLSTGNHGALGWQNMIAGDALAHTTPTRSEAVSVSNSPVSTTVLLPADAIVHSGFISLIPDSTGDTLTVNAAGSHLTSLSSGWLGPEVLPLSSTVISSIHALSPTHQDGYGRDWVEVDIEFSGATQNLTLTSVIFAYRLFENVTGLGPVVKAYHEANNAGGSEPSVDIPLSFTSSSGGLAITGSIYHELMITNEPFTVPSTFHPDGTLQGFTTGHHHLYDQSEIAEVTLIGTDSNGDRIVCEVSSLGNGGVFTQNSGMSMMALDTAASSASLNNGSWSIDWQFEISWDWDDEASVEWTAQAFNHSGEGLAPSTAKSGGSGSQASENDLEIDTWDIYDHSGNLLSNAFDPAYPFYAMAGSLIDVSGSVRFQNTVAIRPLTEDFVVSVEIAGVDNIMNSTAGGLWFGQITMPVNGDEADIRPQIIRVGPIIGANGADDVTLVADHSVLVDSSAPSVLTFEVDTSNGRKTADGFTWDPSSPLKLWATFSESESYSDSMTLYYWRQGMDDDGIYQSMEASMPELSKGEWTISFDNIDVSGVPTNGNVSLYLGGTDWAGLELSEGGSPGLDSDLATLVVATNVDPTIDTDLILVDRYDEYLLPGYSHTFSMQIAEPNGLHTLDLIEVRLVGTEEEVIGVLQIDPRSTTFSTPENSFVEIDSLQVSDVAEGIYHLEVGFNISWELNPDSLPEWALPAVLVYDDDLSNPLITVPNLGQLRWRLDSGMRAVVEMLEDLTPPKSPNGVEDIYIGLGDEVRVSGSVLHDSSGYSSSALPDGISLTVDYVHGFQPRTLTTEVAVDGSWQISFVLDNRQVENPILVLSFALHGLPGESFDVTNDTANIILDSHSPIVTFESLPSSIDSTALYSQIFTVSIRDDGGMSNDPITLNWEFRRPNSGAESSLLNTIPYTIEMGLVEQIGDMWEYSAEVDLTNGSILGLLPGDMLFLWVEASDQAGNSVSGVGTHGDKVSPHLNVRQFIMAIPSIGIAMSDGSTPRGGEVKEGDLLGVTVSLRNLGTKSGNARVELFHAMGEGDSWVSQGFASIELADGQLRTIEPFIFETYESGSQGLFINITGDFDGWDTSTSPLGCSLVGQTISCDLSLEQDMPAVLSRNLDDGEGMDPVMMASIFVLILVVVLAVIVILKRQDGESIYYEEEEWDDVTNTVEQSMTYDAPYAAEPQKVLPPMPTSTYEPAVDSQSSGPPLPDGGLPDGWTMDQWAQYGEQWLMNEGRAETAVEESQSNFEPQYVLSGDGYYYQYLEDGTYANEAYMMAEDGTFTLYQS